MANFYDISARTYVGARYVPMFYQNENGTAEWENNVEYEPLTIVTQNGNAYVSKKNVPKGTPLSNTDYWLRYLNGSNEYKQLMDKVTQSMQDVTQLQEDVNNLNKKIDEINKRDIKYIIMDDWADLQYNNISARQHVANEAYKLGINIGTGIKKILSKLSVDNVKQIFDNTPMKNVKEMIFIIGYHYNISNLSGSDINILIDIVDYVHSHYSDQINVKFYGLTFNKAQAPFEKNGINNYLVKTCVPNVIPFSTCFNGNFPFGEHLYNWIKYIQHIIFFDNWNFNFTFKTDVPFWSQSDNDHLLKLEFQYTQDTISLYMIGAFALPSNDLRSAPHVNNSIVIGAVAGFYCLVKLPGTLSYKIINTTDYVHINIVNVGTGFGEYQIASNGNFSQFFCFLNPVSVLDTGDEHIVQATCLGYQVK